MKKVKIQIKNKWTGCVLFEYEKENNTLKDSIQEAVKRGADLGGADLGGADLRGADLRGADLGGADLRGAGLRGAYLVGAYLVGAYLGGAYLGGAYLGGAYLGDRVIIQDILIIGYIGSRNDYTTAYKTDKGIFVQCGCFRGTIDEFADKVKETHQGTYHERNYLAMVEFIKIKFQ